MSEKQALYHRILNDPISHPDAKKAAEELLNQMAIDECERCLVALKTAELILFEADKEGDTKTLSRFAALVETARKFDLEKFEISLDAAEKILNLAECGYLNRYVEKKL